MTATKRTAGNSTSPKKTAEKAVETLFFSRDESWMRFNQRVLEEAQDESNPLLERVKFLAITASNLDEFVEIRVAGIMQQADSENAVLSIDGLTPREQLRRIYVEVNALVEEQYACWHQELLPALTDQGILFRTAAQLTAKERASAALTHAPPT